jgi:hypothetical protein
VKKELVVIMIIKVRGNMSCYVPSIINKTTINYIPNPIKNIRYSLELDFLGRSGKVLIVILKNPSFTFRSQLIKSINFAQKQLDITTTKVIGYAKNNGYSGIITLNLFPFYHKIARKINNRYGLVSGQIPAANPIKKNRKEYLVNLAEIDKILKAHNSKYVDVVAAWGNPNGIIKSYYDDVIQDVINIASKNGHSLREISKTISSKKGIAAGKQFYPLHAQAWGYSYILIKPHWSMVHRVVRVLFSWASNLRRITFLKIRNEL